MKKLALWNNARKEVSSEQMDMRLQSHYITQLDFGYSDHMM